MKNPTLTKDIVKPLQLHFLEMTALLPSYFKKPQLHFGYRPDMTFAVDWALTTNYLSIYLSLWRYAQF